MSHSSCNCTASRHLEEEMNARDEKYAELDAKFGRLLKRSKQRIQDVQKVDFPSPARSNIYLF